jgi:hypothetical protein
MRDVSSVRRGPATVMLSVVAMGERKIADLQRLRDELDHLAHQCRGGRVSECRIIEALSPNKVT